MRRVLCALAVLAMFAGACSGDPEPAAAPTTVPPTPTPSPTPSPTPPPPPPVAPLTGMELDEEVDRPVLAVKIDNAPAAVPPDGLEDADIVIEEEVEGGLTRFLALFHSQDPEQVGPVRSGREADADLLPPFAPVLAYSGADPSVQRLLRDAGILFFEEGQAGDAFFRVSDRIAPHNLFANTEALWEAGSALESPDEPVFERDEDAPSGGERTPSAELTFSQYASTGWDWKSGPGRWEREQNGSPHATAEGDTLHADNVVIMRIEQRTGSRRDSAGNPTVELIVTGRGDAVVLRDGRAYEVTWRKRDADSHIEWLDSDGEPFPLAPGSTWVELLATGASLELEGSSS